ncbi:unnamed protein product [Polarella glacialis]|uniref:CBM1 domain-containing protein n=1 Tax=Polarella glacialis TaxID=89957 RepID=A0A813IPF7_POLGL|nr:unnamed protein product [Polarella glacialis]
MSRFPAFHDPAELHALPAPSLLAPSVAISAEAQDLTAIATTWPSRLTCLPKRPGAINMPPIARVLAVSAILLRAVLGDVDTSCLFYHGAGCSAIHSEQLCVLSRDGQATSQALGVHGIYHGGSPCAWSKSGLCKKLASVAAEDLSSYASATCEAGDTLDSRLASHTPPSHLKPSADSSDYEGAMMPWSKVALVAVDGGTDRECRGVVKTQTGEGEHVYNMWTAIDLKDCQALCAGACQGVEYQAATKYCEVWYGQIFHSARAPGSECYSLPNKDLDMHLATLRPTDMTCLKPLSQGCSSTKDRDQCLSARDAGDVKEMFGRKLAGEPCVWCGGRACDLDSDSLCQPYDYLMRAAHNNLNPASAANFEVPVCVDGRPGVYLSNALSKDIPAPSQAQLALLSPAPNGCSSITDMGTCLNSKDAGSLANWGFYRMAGEACVWCGGATCTDRNADKCMPYDLLMNGEGRYYFGFRANIHWKVAAILESKAAPNSDWDATCLCSMNAGCPTLTDQYSCLLSQDGRPEGMINGRKVAGQPCVWCAGGRCNSGSTASCEPYDVQMNGEGTIFAQNFAKDHYKVAACQDGLVKSSLQPIISPPTFPLYPPSQAGMACLKNEPGGCSVIKDRLGCLSSIDGSTVGNFGGLKIQGQPCVWCGGKPCATDGPLKSSLCLPFDYLARGAGRGFSSVDNAALTMAECGQSKFEFGDVSCLVPWAVGCNKITDFNTCTSVTDGRPFSFVAGFKAKGQPCVWCGGLPCSEANSNLCEPFDFAVNGKAHAFNSGIDLPTYSVASCSASGMPGPKDLPMASTDELHGTAQVVNCGYPNPIWQKVGQACGFCKALVPRIQESYRTGSDYCSQNGGLTCARVSLGSLSSCEEGRAVTCSYQFALEDNALCECAPKMSPMTLATEVPRPSATELECLVPAKTGCMAVKDKLACLSSKDASGVKSDRTLAVDGEPCVWCGEGSCTSDSNDTCVPYDWLARGQDVAYAVLLQAPSVLVVAQCNGMARSFGNTGCLTTQVNGCSSIKDKANCLSSLDGRPYRQIAGFLVEGQPCVWCGGVACNSNNDNLCEPHDFAVHGTGHAFVTHLAARSYSTAACENGQPVAHELPSALANEGVNMMVNCGVPNPTWSMVSKSCDFCKVQVAVEAMAIIETCSVYCSAQGNLKCYKAWTSFKHSCDVKAAVTCEYHFAADENAVCECDLPIMKPQPWQKLRPTEGEMTCLKSHASGCRDIKDRINCLSSKDGSSMPDQYGLKIRGECGDGLCASGVQDTCAPYEWLMKGQGRVFHTMSAVANFQVAKCFSDKDADFENVQCLQKAAAGCPAMLNEDSCLSAVDGRSTQYVAGFKVAGQPCVWCGGGLCHSLNDNRCESYDFAVNGAGHAFNTFHAEAVYKIAACEDGKPAIQMMASALSEHGISMPVTCGSYTPIWSRVSRSCGNCKVVVPKIQDTFKTCADYCKDQVGNPMCISSAPVHRSTCDKAADVTCDYAFAKDEDALCKCTALPKVLLPHEQQQQTYSQCGGSTWKGPTQCEMGNRCNFVNEYYSQCVLAAAAIAGVDVTDGASSSSVIPAEAAAAAQRAAQVAGEPAIEQVAAAAKAAAAAAGSADPEVPTEQAEEAMAVAAGTAAAAVSVAPQQAATVAEKTADQISVARGETEEQSVVDSVKAAAEAAEVTASKEGSTPHVSADFAKAAATVAALDAGKSAIEAQAVVEPVIAAFTEKVPAQSAQMTPDVIAVLTNIGKDCWEACDRLSGLCSFCGKGNACCRHNTTGEAKQPKECQDILTYFTWHNECVTPVHHVTPQEAAIWAASQAAAAVAAVGGSAQQRVSAAGDAAGETAIRAGAEAEAPEAAAASAAIVAWESDMSGQEDLDAAKAAAGKAAAEAHQSTAGVAEAVVAGVEEAAEQVGVQAAKLTKVDGKSVQEQAVAAAKEAAFAAFDMQQPAQVAEESARVSSMAVATAAGQLALQAEETADTAVKAIISTGALKPAEPGANKALRHAFADCYGNCGNKPGMCNAFCGMGNACCRISGDIVVPPECQNIAAYKTVHYECVVPHLATLVDLVPVSETAMEIQAQATTDGTPSTVAPEGQGGLGIATFLMIGGGVVALVGAGILLSAVYGTTSSTSRAVCLCMEDSDEPSDLEEFDAPLVTQLVPSGAPAFSLEQFDAPLVIQLVPSGAPAFSRTPQVWPTAAPAFAPAAGYAHFPYQQGIRQQAGRSSATPMRPTQEPVAAPSRFLECLNPPPVH